MIKHFAIVCILAFALPAHAAKEYNLKSTAKNGLDLRDHGRYKSWTDCRLAAKDFEKKYPDRAFTCLDA